MFSLYRPVFTSFHKRFLVFCLVLILKIHIVSQCPVNSLDWKDKYRKFDVLIADFYYKLKFYCKLKIKTHATLWQRVAKLQFSQVREPNLNETLALGVSQNQIDHQTKGQWSLLFFWFHLQQVLRLQAKFGTVSFYCRVSSSWYKGLCVSADILGKSVCILVSLF